uniref:Transmembrane protein 120A n=1 Tax=Anolis carolinensis TaxID=28377 RepID=A0A803T699_ANOCA
MPPPPEGTRGGSQGTRETHRLYKQKLEELTKLQDGISSSISRQKRQLKELSLALKKYKSPAIQELQGMVKDRQGVFFEMEAYLPKKNGNYNITLLFAYKDEYEKFKLYLTIILLIISFTCRFLLNSRVTDAVFNFLLVWYYCTLTIRESILINNGSNLEPWQVKWGSKGLKLVGFPSLHLHLPLWSHADLARRTHVPQVPESVPHLLHVPEFCPVSPVLLPKWLPVPAESAGRAAQHGPHCGFHLNVRWYVLWNLLLRVLKQRLDGPLLGGIRVCLPLWQNRVGLDGL